MSQQIHDPARTPLPPAGIQILKHAYNHPGIRVALRKTDKAREHALRAALTRVCDVALATIPGFVWITHFVNYNNFPDSLVIVSVFGTDDALRRARDAQHNLQLHALIRKELQAMDAPINLTERQIRCDSEDACERDNNGNWQQRYQHS